MTDYPSIAGVILTLNEETDLDRALASLAWCDELIVVDSGSTDSTREIALNYQARFYTNIQQPPFLITQQRNWALENCMISSDWVLFLDADEEVNPQLKRSILKNIKLAHDITAFELAPRYLFLGQWLKHTQNYPIWHPRLLRRGHAHFVGGVWESFDSNSKVSRISDPYEHYAFSKGIDSWMERHIRYASWEATKTYQYLRTNNADELSTHRSLAKRRIASYLWPFRPFMRFFEKYFLNLGFLDGYRGLLFSLLMSFYELIIVVKIIEKKRLNLGQPL